MKARLALAAVLLLAPLFAGCTQRTLFADSDPADRKLKYWGDGNDSALRSAKSREQQSEWGFGFPSGSGFQ